jgi:CheY-like chemotaxis protein
VQGLYTSKGLTLEAELSPDLPPLWCDGMRVRQIVINLLSNAGRFTERGGVRVRAWRDKDLVIVSVADTGPGIAPEDQTRIFEPFQQLDNSIRRRHGGSGLGLSISQRFVEMHEGKMWLESQVGVGTTIYFSLPIQAALEMESRGAGVSRWFSEGQQYWPRTRPSRAAAPDVRPRFVVWETGNVLQRLFHRYAGEAQVVGVQDRPAALRALSESPAQALIVNAPPGTGLAAEPVSDLPYDTPSITCFAPGDRQALEQLGAAEYVIKPIERETLLGALDRLGAGIKTVLVADDEPDALQLFVRFLSSAGRGYRVIPVSDGAQALELLRERRPDAVLLDLIMPGLDGFKLLRAKNSDPTIRDIPVIIVSSRDPANDPIVSKTLSVTRSSGLSARDLLDCIAAITQVLTPSEQPARPAQPGTSGG